ncbi:hypothetical protein [Sinomonas atrocyanea]|uniref:hypothetical protein n=1 Tax=Sinomonas atrocyanea TaxID=37927 RepID=UPI0027878C84|nr:hypothetical protein [Sinomonas atrocyanea]MDQ0261927.1 hypothetical protein [Sinomonas atrocyanea]MDR6623691.1 hypothetical protein [Sinomonas atrocyanea]
MPAPRADGRKQAHSDAPHTIEPSTRPASVSPAERRVQIAAAKARITLDQRRGIETPEWIVALSLEERE